MSQLVVRHNNMNAVKNYIISIMATLFLGVLPVSAQSINSPIITVPACASITHTLRYGSDDAHSDGDVTRLQTFLYTKGYLVVNPTGYFGPLTLRAVKVFQRVSASGAVDGIVGPQTQAHIRATDCSVGTTRAPSISSLTPTSGSAGTVVTITGSGFTDNNIVHFAIGGIANIASTNNGTALTFTIPEYIGPYCKPMQACPMYAMLITAGTYQVSVENANGTSATVPFTVTGKSI